MADTLNDKIARGPGVVDFSPFSTLYDSFQAGRRDRRTDDAYETRRRAVVFSDDGTPDFGATAANLIRAGDFAGAASLAQAVPNLQRAMRGGASADRVDLMSFAQTEAAPGGFQIAASPDQGGPDASDPGPRPPALKGGELPEAERPISPAEQIRKRFGTTADLPPTFALAPGPMSRDDANRLLVEARDAVRRGADRGQILKQLHYLGMFVDDSSLGGNK